MINILSFHCVGPVWKVTYMYGVYPCIDAMGPGTICRNACGGSVCASLDYRRAVTTPHGTYQLRRSLFGTTLYHEDARVSRVSVRRASCVSFSLHFSRFKVTMSANNSYLRVYENKQLVAAVQVGVYSQDHTLLDCTIYAVSELASLAAVIGCMQLFRYTEFKDLPQTPPEMDVLNLVERTKYELLQTFKHSLLNSKDYLYVIEQLSTMIPGLAIRIPNILS